MEGANINKQGNEGKEKEVKVKEPRYNAYDLVTKEDVNKDVMITTVLNNQMMGKITRVGAYEIEIITKDNRKFIIYKHAIVSLYFFESQDKGVKK